MSSFDIGLSGLDAAQKAMNVIGNNIANAATEGYHRQDINFAPADSVQIGRLALGRGVEVESVRRMVDDFLEREILRQQSSLNQASMESDILGKIENALGELTLEGGGLNALIDGFFNSMQNLSAHPSENIWQNQIISDAEAMAGQFRNLGSFLDSLDKQVTMEVANEIDYINSLTSQIAQLNFEIERIEKDGGTANTVSDQRDKYISKLSEVIGIQTMSKEHGVVNVSADGLPLVTGSSNFSLELGYDGNGNMGLAMESASNFYSNIQGGKIGGLLTLKNDIISSVSEKLDTLAAAFIQQINRYHVQGVGSEGSFSNLISEPNAGVEFSDMTGVTDGSIFIRVTNTSTGQITRTEIAVDAANDSMNDIATRISAIAGITASVNSWNQLAVSSDVNYKFDFLPAVGSSPTGSTLTGAAPAVTASGVYSGAENDTYTFTVSGTGSVGNGTLELVVTDGDGSTLAILDVGAGYAAGDKIQIGQSGIEIAIGTGDLNDGEAFEVDVFANSDTSGVLAAIGMNTFFTGSNASDISVCSDIKANPKRVATALGADMTDNNNALRMAAVRDETLSQLNSMTCGNFYRVMVSDIGQQYSIKQVRRENLESMVLELSNEKSQVSGVDINDQATKLLVFQQMFQAMAKYMTVTNELIKSLTQLI